jgi:signal transduction histidine kinase
LQSSVETARPRVLIVDDLPQNLLAFEAVLETLDVEIVKANSGKAALSQVLKGDFAVILLDVQMPGLDGFETAKLIKQREKSAHIPIILVTALSREIAHVFKGYEKGAADYLLKPVDENILRAKVQVFAELWRRGKTIERQAAQLGKAKAKDAFLNVIAHELRTPLTTAKAQGQLAVRRLAGKSPETLEALASINKQVDRLTKLTQDLLDSTAFDEGRAVLCYGEFNLCELLEEQRKGLQSIVGETHQLQVRCPSQLPIVADRERIDQALTNLISNSIRYSPRGGVVEIAADLEDGIVHLSVTDRGLGIPPELQPRIFQRFGQAHGAEHGGLGLGLAITRGIVELHAGKIWFESTGVAGEGSTIHVQLPLAPSKPAPA